MEQMVQLLEGVLGLDQVTYRQGPALRDLMEYRRFPFRRFAQENHCPQCPLAYAICRLMAVVVWFLFQGIVSPLFCIFHWKFRSQF